MDYGQDGTGLSADPEQEHWVPENVKGNTLVTPGQS